MPSGVDTSQSCGLQAANRIEINMTNTTSTAVAVPLLLSRAMSKLFGTNEGTFLERHQSFLQGCDDPAELVRKADEHHEEAGAITAVRNRERPAGAMGAQSPEKWEDGIEAFNHVHELKIAIGQLREKAGRITAEAKWREQRAAHAGLVKAAVKETETRKKSARDVADRAAAAYRRAINTREDAEAKSARLVARIDVTRDAHHAAIDNQAGAILADDGAALATGEVAGLAADLQALERAQTLGAKQVASLRSAEAEAKAAAEAAHREWLSASVAHAEARLALRDHADRELFEEWAALRLLQGFGDTPHRAVMIDAKAVMERAAAIRAEFAE